MSNGAIIVQHLQKIYHLYSRPSDRLKEVLFPFGKKRHQKFYALKDITFTLPVGQSLGIVGRNGSGKSTLLKILAGVLTPTAGTVSISGTIGSLLELGGGFNGELTGRENIKVQLMLNGIVEISNDIICRIIDFAELGHFIDQPVKKYSSGMFMRLAFACATTFSPKILIIDEALAVGDAYFVKKCMNRIHELLKDGTTLLFVSHDLESVRQLCNFTLLINHGEQIAFGPTPEVAEQYTALLRMQEQANMVPLSSKVENIPLLESLFQIQGTVDLTEQRLFVRGDWQWHVDESTAITVRRVNQPGAMAAFCTEGNRLSLSFLRGGGFVLPTIYVDGKQLDISTENDLPYPSFHVAPPQVRNFTYTLSKGKHVITIVAKHSPIAWLGGEVSFARSTMQFKMDPEWAASLDKRTTIYGDGKAIITCVELLDFYENPINKIMNGDTVRIRIHAQRKGPVKNVSIGYKIHNRLSVGIFGTSTREEHYALNDEADLWVVEFAFSVPLAGGEYTSSAAIASILGESNVIHHYIDIAMPFYVQSLPRRTVWGEFHNPTRITIQEKINYAEKL